MLTIAILAALIAQVDEPDAQPKPAGRDRAGSYRQLDEDVEGVARPSPMKLRSRLNAPVFNEPHVLGPNRDDVGMNARDLSPQVSIELELFKDGNSGLRTSAVSRFSLLGPEGAPSVETGITAFAPIAFFDLDATAAVGRAVGGREDLDVNASTSIAAPLGALRLGMEARMRGELVDEYKTEEDEGRPVDLLIGPAATLRHERLELKAIGGFASPRGSAPQGAAAQLFLSLEL